MAMGYIWIAMGMGWGVSRSRDDALVMLKRSENKTKAREVERDLYYTAAGEKTAVRTRTSQEPRIGGCK